MGTNGSVVGSNILPHQPHQQH